MSIQNVQRRAGARVAGMVFLAFVCLSGCAPARASGTSFPDYGSMLDLTGANILANTGAYTAGTAIQVVGATRLALWVRIILAGGTALTSGINVQFTCGYSAATDVTMPYMWVDQAGPTLAQTQALTGTAGSTVWHLLQTGAITGAKVGCSAQARSANASAGATTDEITVYAYGY